VRGARLCRLHKLPPREQGYSIRQVQVLGPELSSVLGDKSPTTAVRTQGASSATVSIEALRPKRPAPKLPQLGQLPPHRPPPQLTTVRRARRESKKQKQKVEEVKQRWIEAAGARAVLAAEKLVAAVLENAVAEVEAAVAEKARVLSLPRVSSRLGANFSASANLSVSDGDGDGCADRDATGCTAGHA
jgi:hypothetical protein